LFSVDGILAEDGFFATELNPRLSGGLGLDGAWPELSENLFHRAAQEQLPGVVDADPQVVETEIRAAIRRVPSHEVWIPVPDGFASFEDAEPQGASRLIAPSVAAFAATLGLRLRPCARDAGDPD
jgi:hypothetical protein